MDLVFDRWPGLGQHSELVESSSLAHLAEPDLLLVNPAAGGGLASDVLPDLLGFAKRHNWKVETCVTRSPDDLAAKARTAADAGRKRILVLGGDGTFQVLLNALAGLPTVILGVIPAGGGNDLSASLGLPTDPLQAATLLLNGDIRWLDAARVRTADGKVRLYAGGGGVGLDAEAARYASGAYRNLRGRTRYLLSAIRALLGFRSIRVRLQIHGSATQNLEIRVLLAGVLNTSSYGAGLCLAPEARTDDGELDLVLLEDLRLAEILALLPALMSRGVLNTNRVRRFRLEYLRIETDKPCWFHGDGELLGMTPVEITVVPKAARVLTAARRSRS